MPHGTPIRIPIADDDEEDRALAHEALVTARLANNLHFVKDGEELMDYLHARGRYSAVGSAPRPGLLLLDIKMPRKDGFTCLREIKSDPSLRQIPVAMLTTSSAEADIARGYDLGVNSLVSKPVSLPGLVDAMITLGRYWFEIVDLPPDRDRP
ncbi:MAG: response regulator, partial [Gemmatimonadaceae bacterium]|nr:response regulator [Gemmatimonadaceae bacterium]